MHRCLFKFNSDGDKKKVLVGGPLSFKNVIIALIEPKGVRDLAKLYFTRASFFIQIHNVPISCMNEEIALFLEKNIEEIKKVQVRSYGGYIGHFSSIESNY